MARLLPGVHLVDGAHHALEVLGVGLADLELVTEVDLVGGFLGGQVPLVGKVDGVLEVVPVGRWPHLQFIGMVTTRGRKWSEKVKPDLNGVPQSGSLVPLRFVSILFHQFLHN